MVNTLYIDKSQAQKCNGFHNIISIPRYEDNFSRDHHQDVDRLVSTLIII